MFCACVVVLSALIGLQGRGSIAFLEASAQNQIDVLSQDSAQSGQQLSDGNTLCDLFANRITPPSVTNSSRETPQIVGIFNGAAIQTASRSYCLHAAHGIYHRASSQSSVVSLRKLRI